MTSSVGKMADRAFFYVKIKSSSESLNKRPLKNKGMCSIIWLYARFKSDMHDKTDICMILDGYAR